MRRRGCGFESRRVVLVARLNIDARRREVRKNSSGRAKFAVGLVRERSGASRTPSARKTARPSCVRHSACPGEYTAGAGSSRSPSPAAGRSAAGAAGLPRPRIVAAMIDHTTNPDDRRALRPGSRAARPGAAALPLRQDQRAEVPQAPRRDRRDRPGHGQPDRPARAVGHRQALRGRAATRGTTATASPRASTTSAARSPPSTRSGSASTLDPDHEVVATIGSKEGFSHMCLALLGPGDTALVPAPSFPIHVHAVALASANVIALDVRDSAGLPRQRRPGLREPLPPAQDPDPELPAQPDRRRRRAAVLRGGRQAGQEVPLLRDPRLRLRRHLLRRLRRRRASCRSRAPRTSGCEFTTMSKGYNMAGWRVGFAAGNRADAQRPEGDQGLLRLRHLPGRPDRRDRRPAARRAGPAGPGRRVPACAATCWSTA